MIKPLHTFWVLTLAIFQISYSQTTPLDSIDPNNTKLISPDTTVNTLDSAQTNELIPVDTNLFINSSDSLIDTSLIAQEPPFEPWIQISLNIALSAYSSQDIQKIETATDTLFEEWKEEIREDSSSFPREQGYPGAHVIFPIGASLRLHYSGLSLILGREAWQAGQNNIFSTFENTKEVSWEQWATQYRVGVDWDIPYSFMHFKDSSLITVGIHYLLVDQSILKFENQNSRIMSGQGYELQLSSNFFRYKNTSVRVELFWNTTQLETNDGKGGLLFSDSEENLSWKNTLFGGRFQFLIGI